MQRLTVRCPNCKNIQKYISYHSNYPWEVFGKSTECRRCGKQILIKGARTDNIVKGGWDDE